MSISRREAYSVVVLPLPVGPQASTMPLSRAATVRSFSYIHGSTPSSCSRVGAFDVSSTRSTSFWPCMAGVRLTRKSTRRPLIDTLK